MRLWRGKEVGNLAKLIASMFPLVSWRKMVRVSFLFEPAEGENFLNAYRYEPLTPLLGARLRDCSRMRPARHDAHGIDQRVATCANVYIRARPNDCRLTCQMPSTRLRTRSPRHCQNQYATELSCKRTS